MPKGGSSLQELICLKACRSADTSSRLHTASNTLGIWWAYACINSCIDADIHIVAPRYICILLLFPRVVSCIPALNIDMYLSCQQYIVLQNIRYCVSIKSRETTSKMPLPTSNDSAGERIYALPLQTLIILGMTNFPRCVSRQLLWLSALFKKMVPALHNRVPVTGNRSKEETHAQKMNQ